MNKFEKLIEYVINDEDSKAQDLFHQIVVDKSRKIYESLMDNDEINRDEVDDLLNDVEAEEQGVHEADEEEFGDDEMTIGGDEMSDENDFDMSGDLDSHEMDHAEIDAEEGELEDRVVDLEDKLDELMAEFDALVGDEGSEGMEMGGEEEFGAEDELGGEEEFGSEEEFGDEDEMEESRNPQYQFEAEDEELEEDTEELEEELANELEEAVSLTKVTKGIANKTEGQSVGSASEQGVNVNKKTINNDNSGAKGAQTKPVAFSNYEHSNNSNIPVKDEGYTTEPRQSKVKTPKNSEEGSTNKKSLVKEGAKRRGRPLGSKNKTGRRTTKRKS